jgi:hypothetical protein
VRNGRGLLQPSIKGVSSSMLKHWAAETLYAKTRHSQRSKTIACLR